MPSKRTILLDLSPHELRDSAFSIIIAGFVRLIEGQRVRVRAFALDVYECEWHGESHTN